MTSTVVLALHSALLAAALAATKHEQLEVFHLRGIRQASLVEFLKGCSCVSHWAALIGSGVFSSHKVSILGKLVELSSAYEAAPPQREESHLFQLSRANLMPESPQGQRLQKSL